MVSRLLISCHAISAASFVSGRKVSDSQQVSRPRFHQSHLFRSMPGSVSDDVQRYSSLPRILIQAAPGGT